MGIFKMVMRYEQSLYVYAIQKEKEFLGILDFGN